jgi:putative ATP-binding cassette transporter
MKIISFFLRTSPRYMMLVILGGVVSGIGSIGLLALINSALNNLDKLSGAYVVGFIVLCLLVPFSRVASEIMLNSLGQATIFELRLRLSRQILGAPLRELEKIGPPRLLATLTGDVLSIANSLSIVPILCINVAIVVGCLAFIGWLSPTVLLFIFGFLVIGVTSYQLSVGRAMRYMRLAREQEDALLKQFRALTDGAKELKLHRRRRLMFLSRLLDRTAENLRHHNVKGLAVLSIAGSWGQIFFFAVIGTLIFGVPRVSPVNREVLTGCTLAILFLMGPFGSLLSVFGSLGRASVALRKVEDLGLSLSRTSENDVSIALDIEFKFERLELVGVTHSYQRENEAHDFILGPLDLSFQAGELIFIVGGNGSGKTTFAKLLAGLYIPETGEVRLNNEPVVEENREFYRQFFAVVFADFFLFDNLLGLHEITLDARARDYLHQLQLQHKVEVKDGRFSTTELSQGQRKRLALLTAYLEDRPVYIFDEWAADQDPLFKEIFYGKLLLDLKARGKTVLVISHDDRYYHVADRIIKLDDGQIRFDQRAGEQLPGQSPYLFHPLQPRQQAAPAEKQVSPDNV